MTTKNLTLNPQTPSKKLHIPAIGKWYIQNDCNILFVVHFNSAGQYSLVDIKGGYYYANPTSNIEDVFLGKDYKFTEVSHVDIDITIMN